MTVYIGESPLLYFSLFLTLITSAFLVKKENIFIASLCLFGMYNIFPLANEFGSYSFAFNLFLGVVISSFDKRRREERIFFIARLLIFVLYFSVVKLRCLDDAWQGGDGALIFLKLYHFQSLIDFTGIPFGSLYSSLLNYAVLLTEGLVALLILTKFWRFSCYLGIVFHLVGLFSVNVLNWHFFMIGYFFVTLFSRSLVFNEETKISNSIASEK